MKMQTTGTLMVLVGLIVGAIGGAMHGHAGSPADDWKADIAVYTAVGLVLIGIVVSIVGRVKGGGPV